MKAEEILPFGFEDTSYQAAGGREGITQLVEAFYHQVDTLPKARPLRALYPEDLSLPKQKLTFFLCGWLGGPKLYQQHFGSINIPQAHRAYPLTEQHAEQWLFCMRLAIATQPYSKKFSDYLNQQLSIPAQRIVAASEKTEELE